MRCRPAAAQATRSLRFITRLARPLGSSSPRPSVAQSALARSCRLSGICDFLLLTGSRFDGVRQSRVRTHGEGGLALPGFHSLSLCLLTSGPCLASSPLFPSQPSQPTHPPASRYTFFCQAYRLTSRALESRCLCGSDTTLSRFRFGEPLVGIQVHLGRASDSPRPVLPCASRRLKALSACLTLPPPGHPSS